MATLNTITADGDGTIASIFRTSDGGSPAYTYCNDTPDGLSTDYVENDDTETSGQAWFSLENVNSDFSSMDTLNISIDGWAETAPSNDLLTLTARIADGNGSTTWLTNESATLLSGSDTTRTQPSAVSFSGLTGTKSQWDTAHIRFDFIYSKVAGPDNANLRLYGFEINGTYTAATPSTLAPQTLLLGVG